MAGNGVRRLRAVLGALWTTLRREQESLLKVPANNMYYAAAAFLFMLDPVAMVFFGTIVAVVLFFPMSADPLRHIPPARFQLWPLEAGERRLAVAPSRSQEQRQTRQLTPRENLHDGLSEGDFFSIPLRS